MIRPLIAAVALSGLGILSLACNETSASSAGVRTAQGMAQQPTTPSYKVSFGQDGKLARPRGYRRWIYIGAPLTPNDMNNGKAAFPEFHSVYIDPVSYDHYKQHGVWRDGTVVVKELVSVGTKSSSSGAGYFMGEFLGVEVALKDEKRFPDEPGHWGYFRFTDEKGGPPHQRAEQMPTAACATCHAATAAEDLVFTQHYPVLRAAKNVGNVEPEDR